MKRARGASWRRTAQRKAIRAIRAAGLVPATLPDRYGEDDELADARWTQTVLVYFPDARNSLYQLRQWYDPLLALDAEHPVILVFQDSRTAKIVRAELPLPAVTIARYGTLDAILNRSDVKLALYVNHTATNFQCLRFTSLAHVYLAHGESDKGVSTSNQCKAYDFCFVAGQAAIDRMAAALMFTDATTWCRTIGRPQLDSVAMARRGTGTGDRATVLYAPTWEGAQPSVAYGSLSVMGVSVARALLDSERFRLVYRPHPLSGVTDGAYGAADAEIRRLVEAAAERDPAAGHRVDTGTDIFEAFSDADLLLCDVSAVAIDWLPTERPLIVTEPSHAQSVLARTRLMDSVPRLQLQDVGSLPDLVSEQITDDPGRAERLGLVEYYLGDTSPGASTRRFVDACTQVIVERDAQWAEILDRTRPTAGGDRS